MRSYPYSEFTKTPVGARPVWWHVAGPMNPPLLKLVVLRERLAVCRLDAKAPIPEWATGEVFLSISRTRDELSVVCEDRFVPEGTRASRGWQGFKIEGPLALDLVGILVSVAVPLAQSNIGILPIATYETDYVFVRDQQLDGAIKALRFAGFEVVDPQDPSEVTTE
jgi:uncharacterized protein